MAPSSAPAAQHLLLITCCGMSARGVGWAPKQRASRERTVVPLCNLPKHCVVLCALCSEQTHVHGAPLLIVLWADFCLAISYVRRKSELLQAQCLVFLCCVLSLLLAGGSPGWDNEEIGISGSSHTPVCAGAARAVPVSCALGLSAAKGRSCGLCTDPTGTPCGQRE